MATLTLNTPTGPFRLVEDDGAIIRAEWRRGASKDINPLLKETAQQIRAYFNGNLQVFDVPLRVRGSEFQRSVCDAIHAIPFGQTRTYGDIAKELGQPAQSVGKACGGNPIAILIPCHRVLGGDSLGGFSGRGGVDTKIALLKIEGAASLLL